MFFVHFICEICHIFIQLKYVMFWLFTFSLEYSLPSFSRGLNYISLLDTLWSLLWRAVILTTQFDSPELSDLNVYNVSYFPLHSISHLISIGRKLSISLENSPTKFIFNQKFCKLYFESFGRSILEIMKNFIDDEVAILCIICAKIRKKN